ncbi:MAG: T9SS type A sorting domain-containing protein [Aureispira sp.]|nr:T9SS type A sorting domain-containing protein [Aureispira sp.]
MDWRVYPNPTSNFLQIELKNETDDFVFELFNHTGQLLLRTKKNKIDVSTFSKGMYYLKIINTEKLESSCKKWLKH